MKVVILAAGLGSRLEPSIDESIPKAFVSIGSETILERQIRQLSIPEITEIIAVIGRQGDCWTNEAVDRFCDKVDKVVINEVNAETEAGYSFLQGLKSISSDENVLIIDGDIVIEDQTLESIRTHEAENIALVRATETKIGVNNGACVKFEGKEKIARCGFDVRSNYVYSGVMRLSASCVEGLKQKELERYENEQLATLIDEIAEEKILTGHTINPRTVTTPTVEEPLDEYAGTGETILEKRKGKVTKRAVSGGKKLRDEIERLQYGYARHPNRFPEILDISFFADEPLYEMPDYTDRGYTPLDELIRSEADPQKVSELVESVLTFILEDFGQETESIPGLCRNSFLPKIRTRYADIDEETPLIGPVAEAELINVNGSRISGLPQVVDTLREGTEFLGSIEPHHMTDIHGDFKPDNILVDETTGEFVLIDPRGRSEIGTVTQDSLYDVAKFLTSTYGYYTAFRNKEFKLSVDTDSGVVINYEISENKNTYEMLTEIAIEKAEDYLDEESMNLETRIKALTGLLLVSNAPVHADKETQNQMATAQLARGLELFNEALEDFSPRANQEGDVININTGTDLDLARKLFHQGEFSSWDR